MNRRVWSGVLAGVAAAAIVVSVATGAYRAGQRHEVVARTVGDGEVVRVVDGRGWGHGPGPGFLLFPLLGVTLVILLARRGRHWSGGWYGPCGPGPGGPPGPGGAGAGFDEWHRRAHEAGDQPAGSPAPGR